MNILGISAFYHDAAVALLRDGEIVAAAQEERFTRKKHDPSFPINSLKFCLNYGGLDITDIDSIIFYEKPFLKFERLLETYHAFAPRGLKSFLSAIPIWMKEKVFMKKLIKDELFQLEGFDKNKTNLLFSEHHLSHAASAFYPSPFRDAAIITVDGVGEWATASIGLGEENNITFLKELQFPHSVGLLYSAFTYYLGFKVNSGEYKLMGLAPYGDPSSERVKDYRKAIYENLIDVKEDGSIWLNQEYFDYSIGLKMTEDSKWQELFGFPKRVSETEMEQHHCDLALAIQQITEDIIIKMGKSAQKLTGAKNLCIAGGVALNCVANANLMKAGIYDDIWIQPAAGDAGGALGAALAAHHIYYGNKREIDIDHNKMQGSYLGPEYSDLDIKMTARRYNAKYKCYENLEEMCDTVAELLSQGMVVGWFQGRMEWGPRALGNRSILGDARNEEMQKRLNMKIKFRESFRPFAPSVLYEDTQDYFDIDRASPYMLLIADVQEQRRNSLPQDYHKLPVKQKLYYIRSDIPAITHLDFSARLQTVQRESNPRYWMLIEAFKKKTGYGVIVNTSFNVRGEPIVCTPEDAYRCFMRTDMDYLVAGNYVFEKSEQPSWNEKRDWKEEFVLD
jgi:carbamoyltransferase